MERKHLYLTLSVLLAVSIIVTTLFVSGVLPVKAPVTGSDNYLGNTSDDNTKPEQESGLAFSKDSLLEKKAQGDIENQWAKKNSIDINNNSPEYEVEMYLCYDNDKIPFIETKYYMEGASKSCLYSTSEIPSLKEFTGEDNNKFRISDGTLNTKHAKLYFFVEKELKPKEILFDFYVLNLKDDKINKLHNGKGCNFNNLIFSPDKEYVAFSYLTNNIDDAGKVNDEWNTDNSMKDSFIQIFNCVNDNILISENKTPTGKAIGKVEGNNKFYSYSIVRWKSSEELRLKEYTYTWNKEKSAKENESEIDVIFSIGENKVIYQGEKTQVDKEQSKAQEDTQSKNDTRNNYAEQEQKPEQAGEAMGSEQENDTGSESQSVVQDNGSSGGNEEDSGSSASSPKSSTTKGNIGEGDSSKDSETKDDMQGDSKGKDDLMDGVPENSISESSVPENSNSDSIDSSDKKGDAGQTFSEAAIVLKKFYEHINDGAYEKAYDLLDERVRFNAFKKLFEQMFETTENIEINKSDIDIKYFALFIETTGMFRNDEIDKIIHEEITGNVSKIHYYHNMIEVKDGASQETTMPMVATLNKTKSGWKIEAFDDGDANDKPFNTSSF